MTDIIEKTTIRKAFVRLMPLLLLCYFLAYIDRINIGFASLTMNKDVGLSAYIYGLGAGLFFWGYFFFEVPSNLIMEKVGARRWISRIMVTWGIVSIGMIFVSGPISFLVMRFLLGAAEASFFPGVILYLTYWFPAAYRARIIAAFMVETSQAEIAYHKLIELAEVDWFDEDVTYDDYLADFSAQFHDIRGAGPSEEFSASLAADSYLASPDLASRLFEEGSLGVVYPSVRHSGGTCIACFRPALVMNVRKGPTYQFVWDGRGAPQVSAI